MYKRQVMDMGYPRHQSRRRKYRWQRCLAAWLVLCLLLGNMNFEILLTYATESRAKTFEIGADVTAELKDGVLTVKGHGDTENFTEDTAPFLEYADEIRSLSIEKMCIRDRTIAEGTNVTLPDDLVFSTEAITADKPGSKLDVFSPSGTIA